MGRGGGALCWGRVGLEIKFLLLELDKGVGEEDKPYYRHFFLR